MPARRFGRSSPSCLTPLGATRPFAHVLDMLIGMEFAEDYLDPASVIWRFMRCTGMAPRQAGNEPESIADFLPTIAKEGGHGEAFAYREPNIFVLGWIVRRVTGSDLATLVSERIWQHIGAEHDSYFMVDSTGAETTTAATLRDFVRFGQLICEGGVVDGKRVIPAEVIDDICAGGDPALFAKAGYETMPGWSYRSQWWIRHVDDRRCPEARGAHGQVLYVDPTNDLVIGRFGSAPKPPSYLLDHVLLPTFDAITSALT